MGLIGAKRTRITVHRSEEVIPGNISVDKRLIRQGTSVSSDGETDIFPDTVSESWLTTISRENQLSEFIEGISKLYLQIQNSFLYPRTGPGSAGWETSSRISGVG